MVCSQALSDYAFRAFGYGERLLPRGEITLCEQFVLIGSGMMWNIYFALLAVAFGFFFALALAMMKSSENPFLRAPAAGFIFLFRGSPLFIQFSSLTRCSCCCPTRHCSALLTRERSPRPGLAR